MGIRSLFKRELIVTTCVIIGSLYIVGYANATGTECGRKGVPNNALVTDLKDVGLLVEVPGQLQLAIECHGWENQCADKSSWSSSDERASFIKSLEDSYNSVPKTLHPHNLYEVFRKRIAETISPIVAPLQGCRIPDPVILVKSPNRLPDMESYPAPVKRGKEIKTFIEQPDHLTLFVRLSFVDAANAKIAILRTDFYRPDLAHTKSAAQVHAGKTTAIFLNTPASP